MKVNSRKNTIITSIFVALSLGGLITAIPRTKDAYITTIEAPSGSEFLITSALPWYPLELTEQIESIVVRFVSDDTLTFPSSKDGAPSIALAKDNRIFRLIVTDLNNSKTTIFAVDQIYKKIGGPNDFYRKNILTIDEKGTVSLSRDK